MNHFDIIIPVGREDCLIVKKNIKYIRKNISANRIYIITSHKNFSRFRAKFKTEYNVELIDENSLIEGVTFNEVAEAAAVRLPGWYFQQFLKMGFALSKYAKEHYLIWDADTFPLQPLNFFEEGKILFARMVEHHEPYFVTLKKILGIGKQVPYSFVAEHMMIEVELMKKLLHDIGTSEPEGNNWVYKILNAIDRNELNSFSEFETYGSFVTKFHHEKYTNRHLRNFRHAGLIFGRGVTDKHLSLLSVDHETASFEKWDIPLFPYNISHYFFRILSRLA